MLSKMAKNDMLKEEKRLNNEEFIELLPHLEPYEALMVQVKLFNTWKYLFWYNRAKTFVGCSICGVKLYGNGFIDHSQNVHHLHNLSKVKQFYHPIYTYIKPAKELAQGLSASFSELRDATTTANEELKKSFIYDCKNAQNFVKELCRGDPKDISKIDLKLVNLNSNITDTAQMCVIVGIPMSAMQTMKYSIKENEWIPMLSSKDWNEKSEFYCKLCEKYCVGILTVNAHFNGWQHKSLQIQTLGVRVDGYKHLTKNCCFRYSKHYTIALKDNAEKIMQPFKNDNNIDIAATEMNMDDIEMECNTMKPEKPFLSAEVAAKAKALSAIANNVLKSGDKSKTKTKTVENTENEGLIGVEYVIKLMKSEDDTTPMFECCLCNVGMSESRMQNHLISYNHRLKYCEIHYPDTLNKHNTQMGRLKYYDYFRVMGPILAKLAWAIEQHHGRSLPYTVSASKYEKCRSEIHSQVHDFLHACQTHGPSFANIVSKQDIDAFICNIEDYKAAIASNDSNRRFTIVSSDKIYLNQRHNNPNIREVDRRKNAIRTINNNKHSSANITHESNKRLRSRSPRDHCETETEDKSSKVEILYKKYRKNPESHPLYDREWDSFWRRRKEELISIGIDHRTYNYQPEWVHYFKSRVEELYEEDILEERIKMKKKIEKKRPSPIRLAPSQKSSADRNKYPEYPGTDHTHMSQQNKRPRITEINEYTNWNSVDDRLNSSTQWSNNFATQTQQSTQKPPEPLQQSQQQKAQIALISDGKASVIHCLRLLVAFEDYLGSLGSKVMDLLSKALVFEKSIRTTRELEEKILNASNCTLLETVMEKLKGILYAGLLDDNKVVGFNRVIHHTSEILQHADKMGWRNIPPENTEKIIPHVQLDQLINAVQNKRINQSNEKSLSDTLMELMSARKPNNTNAIQNRDSIATATNPSQSFHSNTAVSNQTFGRRNEKNDVPFNYTGSTKNNLANYNMNRVDNTGLSNFNTCLNTDNHQRFVPSDGFGLGAGRNNYNNQYNNTNYNQSSNFGYQSEYGHSSSNINLTNNGKAGYRKPVGNNSSGSGAAAGNSWKGYRNNEQW